MHPRLGSFAAAPLLALAPGRSGRAPLRSPLQLRALSRAAAPAASPQPPPRRAAAVPSRRRASCRPPHPSSPRSARTPSSWPASDLAGVTQQPFVGLSLQDALAMALGKNTDLAVAASSQKIAGFQIVAAQGAYDLRFQIAPSYTYAKNAPQNAFAAAADGGPITQSTFGASASLGGQTGAGTRYSIGTSATRINNNNASNSFDPDLYDLALPEPDAAAPAGREDRRFAPRPQAREDRRRRTRATRFCSRART